MDNMGGSAPPPPPPPPPPDGGGTGGGFGPRSIGDIISAAWDVYQKNFAQLLTITAIVVVPGALIYALLLEMALDDFGISVNEATNEISVGRGFFASLLIGAVAGFVSYLVQQLLVGSLTRGAATTLVGRQVDVAASYRYAFARLGGLVILAILYALIVAAGLMLLIIPGLIFGVFLSVAVPAFLIERKTPSEALSRSWNLVSGSWWHAFGTIVITAILTSVVTSILNAIGRGSFFGVWITTSIALILTVPFVALVTVVLYVDLRARRENLDGATLQRELDAAQA
jgi:hypothetical protein